MSDQQPRDLSGTDHEELRAFNEKRRWFEARLQRLDELPTIYPFSDDWTKHADQESGSDELDRNETNFAQLLQWQQERDAMEDEVIAFDGGDLVRMKEKTRAVTLIPLTSPSTELVSITLALILVVDRLLTLLRQRADLLEICQLRWDWDVLRSRCWTTLDHSQAGLYQIADAYCRWLPDSDCDAQLSARIADVPISPEPRTDLDTHSAGSTVFTSPDFFKTMDHAIASHISPASSSATASSWLGSVERSRAFTIQSTIDSLFRTEVAECGFMLDRMIDIASPLKALPGLAQSTPNAGAIPDAVLDMQDQLETRAAAILAEAGWYRSLENRCGSIERFHDALRRARTRAVAIQQQLQQLIGATEIEPHDISQLRQALERATRDLPPTLQPFDCSPCSQRVAVGETDARLVSRAGDLRQEVVSLLSGTRAQVDWLDRLALHRVDLLSCKPDISRLHFEADTLLRSIPFSDKCHHTASSAHEWQDRSQAILDRLNNRDLVRSATVGLMKYRAALRAQPESTDISLHNFAQLEQEMDGILAELVDRKDRLGKVIISVKHDCAFLARLCPLEDTSHRLRDALVDLEREVVAAIDGTLWPLAPTTIPRDHPEWRARLDDIAVEVDKIDVELTSLYKLSITGLHLADRREEARRQVDEFQRAQVSLLRLLDLHDRARVQTRHVLAVLIETDDLIRACMEEPATAKALADLHDEVDAWEASVAARTTFIDIFTSQGAGCSATTSRRSIFASVSSTPVAPPTPPPSPPPTLSNTSMLERWDLGAVDRAVRAEINGLTARVRGRLSSLQVGGRSTSPRPTDEVPEIQSDSHTILDARPPVASTATVSASITPIRPSGLVSLPRSASTKALGSASSSRATTPLTRSNPSSVRARPARISMGSLSIPRKYVANVNNQLDRAVGHIVNKMTTHVPIKPLDADDRYEWTDVTGSYWIGAEGRAKLCYCRILPSQTVMVRVGGGWSELPKYLAEHFGESLADPDRSLGDPDQSVPATPARRHVSAKSMSMTGSLSRSTSSQPSLSISSNSPLEPLRFMRKASDSPDDRRREKDKLKVGRRSILGKEAP